MLVDLLVRRFVPDPSLKAAYDAGFARYTALFHALRPLYAER